MENEVILVDSAPLELIAHVDDETQERYEAVELHGRILREGEAAALAFVNYSISLKEMRDRGLYTALGYNGFDDYTQNALGIKERQAYNYINNLERLGIQYLQSNANLGVTKLQLLAAAAPEDRAKVVETSDIENMTVKELETALKQIEALTNQISFLETEKANAQTDSPEDAPSLDEIKAEIRAELDAEIEEFYQNRLDNLEKKHTDEIETLKNKVDNADEEFAIYKANADKEAKLAAAEETKKLKVQIKEAKDAEKSKEEQLVKEAAARKAAEEIANKAAEDIKRIAELEAKIATAESEKQAVEKQIKLSNDPELARFKYMFEAWQSSTANLTEQLGKLETERQAKMKAAVKSVLEGMGL